MKCPKCEEGKLCKIQFKKNKKSAYLCDVCESFWYTDEQICLETGHVLESYAEGCDPEDTFVYLDAIDMDRQEVKQERELYEQL